MNIRILARVIVSLCVLPIAATSAFATDTGCVSINMQGLETPVELGEKLEIRANLSNGCNYPVVSSAILRCIGPGGRLIETPMVLDVKETFTTAKVVIETRGFRYIAGNSGMCQIFFSQCRIDSVTCLERFTIEVPYSELVAEKTAESSPAGQPEPEISDSQGSNSGSTFRRLGRILGGVAIAGGLLVYADSNNQREQGAFDEAKDSEELAIKAASAGVILLLLARERDEGAASFLDFKLDAPPHGWNTSLWFDPVNKGIGIRATYTIE